MVNHESRQDRVDDWDSLQVKVKVKIFQRKVKVKVKICKENGKTLVKVK